MVHRHPEHEPEEREPEEHRARERESQRPRVVGRDTERERMEAPLAPHGDRWTVAGPLRPVASDERIQELELAAHATVADAAPLGLAAFAAATFTLGSIEAGWTEIVGGAAATPSFIAAIPMLIIFGGLTQFIAAMWAFRKGSTFWATFLGVFGALYLTLGLGVLLIGTTAFPVGGVTVPTVAGGVAIAMFAFIAAYLTWASMGVSTVITGVVGFLTVSLALLAVAFFIGGAPLVVVAAGYAGIVAALFAFYASAAIVINSTLMREVLPY